MFCKICGTQLKDGSNFCMKCGTDLRPSAEKEAPVVSDPFADRTKEAAEAIAPAPGSPGPEPFAGAPTAPEPSYSEPVTLFETPAKHGFFGNGTLTLTTESIIYRDSKGTDNREFKLATIMTLRDSPDHIVIRGRDNLESAFKVPNGRQWSDQIVKAMEDNI